MTWNRITHQANYLRLALIISFVIALVVQLPLLLEPAAVEEDFRNLYWVHRFEDPELFEKVSLEQLGVRDVQIGPVTLVIETASPGYSLLLQAGSVLMPTVLFTKILIFPLLLASVFFIFWIGEHLADRRSALFLSLAFIVLNLASHTEISVSGGLHRSFTTPFLLGLLYFLLQKHHLGAAIMVFLSGVIYLPIFPVCAMTCFFCAISLRENKQWSLQIDWRLLAYLSLATVFVLLAVSPTILPLLDRVSSPSTPGEEARVSVLQDPEFQADGRTALFQAFPFVGRGGFVSGNSFVPLYLLFLLLLAVVVVAMRGRQVRRLSAPFYSLLIASFAGFALAWLGLLLTSSYIFYIPNRHTQSSFFLLLMIFVMVNLEEALKFSLKWIMAHRRQVVWYLLPVMMIMLGIAVFLPEQQPDSAPIVLRNSSTRLALVALTMLLFALTLLVARRQQAGVATPQQSVRKLPPYLVPGSVGLLLAISPLFILAIRPFSGNFYFPSEAEKALFAYVETLPKDSQIGGEPCILDSIPFYGKRSVLYHCERFQATSDPETVRAMLAAYYAESGTTVYQFCREYGVDYLVVDGKTYEPDFIAAGDFFYSPYKEWLAAEIRGQTTFALADVPEEMKLFQAGAYSVISCAADVLISAR